MLKILTAIQFISISRSIQSQNSKAMVYGIENHGLSYQTSTPTCIRRESLSGVTCENFNSANLLHPQISTTTSSTNGRKRNTNTIITADGCNIDLSGLTREERRRKLTKLLKKFTHLLQISLILNRKTPSYPKI